MHPPPISPWLTLMGGDTSRLKATGLEIASKTSRVILAIIKRRVIRCSKFSGDRVTETEARGRRDLVAPCYFAARAKMPESGYCYSPVCILCQIAGQLMLPRGPRKAALRVVERTVGFASRHHEVTTACQNCRRNTPAAHRFPKRNNRDPTVTAVCPIADCQKTKISSRLTL